MRRLSKLFQHRDMLEMSTSLPTASLDTSSAFPSLADFYRYRKQRGVNLGTQNNLQSRWFITFESCQGSWFVLERWITEQPFQAASSPGQSDLDVARGSNAKEILERHWDTWITEVDWSWIADRGINAVRIPVSHP